MFSVITPTYNRENTLDRVFNSLKNQTYKQFHWVIIDDASTDNTRALVEQWIREKQEFKIEYHQLPENKGKPFALNFGFAYCVEPITIIADSDDSFEPNTLNDLKGIWHTIDNSINRERIATVWTLVKDENDNLVGEEFPKNFWQVSFEERILNRKNPILGEKWHSWRTSVLRKYNMCYNANSFVSESATWYRINKDFDFLCVNLIHRKYWHSEDGLIHQKKSKLKIAKIGYYTSYYQLSEVVPFQILKRKYFRLLAFEYTKTSFYYIDKKKQLSFLKTIICFLIFIFYAPQRLTRKI